MEGGHILKKPFLSSLVGIGKIVDKYEANMAFVQNTKNIVH